MTASLFSPSEWSKAMQRGVGAIGTIGIILGAYFAVDSWAEDKISESELKQIKSVAEQQALNDINHSKIIQSQRIETAQTNISIVEIKMESVEDKISEREDAGKAPTDLQRRQMDRLTKLHETYEKEEEDATTKLTRITTTTVTTTTTTTDGGT